MNAGVTISQPGGMTMTILLSLVVGKTVGIAGFTIVGHRYLGAKIPEGITVSDVIMIGTEDGRSRFM